MMQLIKLGAAVLNQTPMAWEQNKANILAAISKARDEGVGILCLPEMCVSGYGVEDSFHSPGMLEMAWRVVREILPATEGIIVTLGIPLLYRNALFNTGVLGREWSGTRIRREAFPRGRWHPLRAAMVQGVAERRARGGDARRAFLSGRRHLV
jgi:predicted amidohydrolase